jgi:hypothetical protein
MASCAAAFSRGNWCVFSKKICPAASSIRGFARNDRSRPVTCAIPNDFDSSKREESLLPRKIAMRSTSSVRASRSTSDESILSRSVSELSSRPNSISVRR